MPDEFFPRTGSQQTPTATERVTWGAVELQVTNLERSAAYWSGALGLLVRTTTDADVVALGTRARTLVVLRAGAIRPAASGHAGLYHLAIGVPDQREFSRLMERMTLHGIDHRPVDHTMSKAIYLRDPDGLDIEISLHTPERFARYEDLAQGFGLVDAAGRRRSGRDPLDIPWELSQAEDGDPSAPIADDTTIAHLHLHVPELDAAMRFFEAVGFGRNLFLPRLGFADMDAGGAYAHRLGLNIWAGHGAAPAPERSARLIGYTVHASDVAVVETARRRLQAPAGGDRVICTDPAGIKLTLAGPAWST